MAHNAQSAITRNRVHIDRHIGVTTLQAPQKACDHKRILVPMHNHRGHRREFFSRCDAINKRRNSVRGAFKLPVGHAASIRYAYRDLVRIVGGMPRDAI